ncbi:hypothetical protein REJ27_001178 [Providencia rettgeri]|uniref:hypothetical protein n=1 Tax=Providencia rettgeri TaxID=587 RepID=UPI001BCD4EDC|nr:hypothetical protein [Providencia rettgeri]ELR5287182.1 hypothetical protein [Providencia rettgeri]MDT5427515.1 hypothetical protein [Providencia rettgeri]
MTKSLIDTAKKKLNLVNVVMKNGSFAINSDLKATFIEEEFGDGRNTETQTMCGVIQAYPLIAKDESQYAYIFEFEAAVRILSKDAEDNEIIIFMINGLFEVSYNSKEKLREEELKAFANAQIAFDAWPYWRSFVHESCSKMGTPRLRIGGYIPNSN